MSALLRTLPASLAEQRAQREIDVALAEHRKFKVPALGESQISFMWSADCEVLVECHLEYSPADGDGWNTPYHPESVCLGAAYLRGVDILLLLDAKQIERIEELALIQRGEQ